MKLKEELIMGYWKKERKWECCKKECKPYINLYGGTAATGGVVSFTECGPECGFDECRSDIIVQHEGVYLISFSGLGGTVRLFINGVLQPIGQTLYCLKCGDKIRLVNTSTTTAVTDASLTIVKVN